MNETCKYFSGLINEYIENCLSEEQKTMLEKHLEDCTHCNEELKLTKETLKTIKTLKSLEVPECNEDFASNIILKLSKDKPKNTIIKVSFLKYAAASAVVAVIIGAIAISMHGIKDSQPIAIQPDNNTEISSNVFNEDLELESLFYDDSSILADSGMPLDEWGLIDINEL